MSCKFKREDLKEGKVYWVKGWSFGFPRDASLQRNDGMGVLARLDEIYRGKYKSNWYTMYSVTMLIGDDELKALGRKSDETKLVFWSPSKFIREVQ